MQIRTAQPSDASEIVRIYAPMVAKTGVSFEEVVPSVEEMQDRIVATTATHPWLIAESEQGEVLGYAYACQHRSRSAYRWSTEVSVYIAPGWKRQGIGKTLYAQLFDELRAAGFVNAYAGITLPNHASVGLHEALGFKKIGVYAAVGYKNGSWYDVGWWGLKLQSPSTPKELTRG